MQCAVTRKISYARSEARKAAEQLQRMEAVEGEPEAPLNIYKCRACGRWHVGHNRYARETA